MFDITYSPFITARRSASHLAHLTSLRQLKTSHKYSITPLIRKIVIRISNYPDRLFPSGKFCQEFYETNLPYVLPVIGSRTVECHCFYNYKLGVVEKLRPRYILPTVTATLQTANLAYFQRKIRLYLM